MSDDFEQQEWLKFGVAATLSKQYAQDERQFLEQLASMLEAALPGEIDIGRKGGFFAKKTVQRVSAHVWAKIATRWKIRGMDRCKPRGRASCAASPSKPSRCPCRTGWPNSARLSMSAPAPAPMPAKPCRAWWDKSLI